MSPSRLTSPRTSPPATFVDASANVANFQLPAGTVQPVAGTLPVIFSQVPSPSSGEVAVNVSTILRSPVDVRCSAGCARSTPLSRMPMVVPRPSQVGCWRLKTTEPVSLVGMNGLSSAVPAPGPPVTGGCFGPGWSGRTSGSGTTSSRSSASIDGSATVSSTLPVGTTALK